VRQLVNGFGLVDLVTPLTGVGHDARLLAGGFLGHLALAGTCYGLQRVLRYGESLTILTLRTIGKTPALTGCRRTSYRLQIQVTGGRRNDHLTHRTNLVIGTGGLFTVRGMAGSHNLLRVEISTTISRTSEGHHASRKTARRDRNHTSVVNVGIFINIDGGIADLIPTDHTIDNLGTGINTGCRSHHRIARSMRPGERFKDLLAACITNSRAIAISFRNAIRRRVEDPLHALKIMGLQLGILRIEFTAAGTLGIIRTGSFGVGVLTGSRDNFRLGLGVTANTGKKLLTIILTGLLFDDLCLVFVGMRPGIEIITIVRRSSAQPPSAVLVLIQVIRVRTSRQCTRLLVGTIRIHEPGIVDMDSFVIFSLLCIAQRLIGHIALTSNQLQLCLCAFHAGNRSAAISRENVTVRGVHHAIPLDLRINQISFGTVVVLARGISDRNQLVRSRRTNILIPLIHIVNIDLEACSKLTSGRSANFNHRARQQRNILAHGDRAAVHLNREIAVHGQHIVLGVQAGCANLHADAVNAHRAVVDLDDHAVSSAIVLLYDFARRQVEHRVAGTDEADGRTEGRRGHVNRRVAVFRRTGLQRQRNFNVLHIILSQREYTILHTGTLRTAAEVADLEHLVDLGAAVGGHRTAASNEAIRIQRTTVVNGNVAVTLHAQEADIAGRRTAIQVAALSILMLGRQAQCTIDGQCHIIRQRQRAVLMRRAICTRRAGRSRIQGVDFVKGNQQGNTRRNDRIVIQRRAVQQNDVLGSSRLNCCVCCISQVVKQLRLAYLVIGSSCAQPTIFVFFGCRTTQRKHSLRRASENRLDSHDSCRRQSIACCCGQ